MNLSNLQRAREEFHEGGSERIEIILENEQLDGCCYCYHTLEKTTPKNDGKLITRCLVET